VFDGGRTGIRGEEFGSMYKYGEELSDSLSYNRGLNAMGLVFETEEGVHLTCVHLRTIGGKTTKQE
jgi:hypothetical protein